MALEKLHDVIINYLLECSKGMQSCCIAQSSLYFFQCLAFIVIIGNIDRYGAIGAVIKKEKQVMTFMVIATDIVVNIQS